MACVLLLFSFELFAQAITATHALTFPSTVAGSISNITVSTYDAGAASFTANGLASTPFTKAIVESSIQMIHSTNAGQNIVVDTFILEGPSVFDLSGNATGLKVGATAHITASNVAGHYSGSGTFRIVY